MTLVQLDISKEADRKVKQYMVDQDISDKRVAINKILEDM